MKMFLIYLFVFWLGHAFGRWDEKYGAEYGHKAGRWTRVHILGLPPVENDRIEP